METYSKIFLDEINHHRVKIEMGEDDSYEKGNSFDLDQRKSPNFQDTTDWGHIDEKTEFIDIVQHYTDENGIRSSIKYEKGELALNQKNNLEGHIDAVHLNERDDYAANHKVQLKIHIDSVHLNKKKHKCYLCDYRRPELKRLQQRGYCEQLKRKTLRTITGYKLADRQRNSVIREKCQVDDVVRWIRKRRREWNHHVNRMSLDRMAKFTRGQQTPIK
ncbi:uncharacterized protein LOC123672891 [Harmonia axyridis]|uniref:uncharacterized protein LOC123672891 n=1 Tax=Harmonia axyridis TaxID=115357 RepID=UPI001E279A3D|nr:uncharacterized protein LOC123672891 [Harmonia axyridis]